MDVAVVDRTVEMPDLDTVASRGRERAPEVARAMLARIKDYLLKHLAEPDLSPEMIAAAHHISVRYLHKLFEFEEITVGRWIQRRRLEMCRRDLARQATLGSSVAAIAQRWGFVSPAHFSRTFRATYGVTPREWQAMARNGDRR